jgi:hypothetical protein
MENEKLIREKILEIAKLNVYLWQNGGATACPNEFERLLPLQEDLLSKFGLPAYRKFCELFNYMKMPRKQTIDKTIEQLHKCAQEYLSKEVLTREQFLEASINSALSAHDVLIELGITPHCYTTFVYYRILTKRIDSVSNVLKLLDFVNKGDMLNNIGIITYYKKTAPEYKSAEKAIKAAGIPLMKEYLTYIRKLNRIQTQAKTKQDENSHEVPF